MRRSTLLFDQSNQSTPAFRDFLKDVGIPGTSLADIDSALQKRFFQKDPVTQQPLERWELKEVEVACPPERIKQHLAACGFLNETNPSNKVYDYAAWPGALITRAVVRLSDLIAVWANDGVRWKQTIVFGGKRPLQSDKENYIQCCKALNAESEHPNVRASWQRINPQTELDIMKWLWENMPGPRDCMENVVFVDAPMKSPVKEGGQPIRPNTEDTILEWLKGKPNPGSMLLSSGAPYGMAMDEAFWMLLKPHGFTVETFGHAAPDLPIENLMREAAGAVNRIRRARKA